MTEQQNKVQGKHVVSCISGIALSDVICDYGLWAAAQKEQSLQILCTLNHQDVETSSNLSGIIGLGARSKLLDELIDIEHAQNKLGNRKAKVVLEAAKQRVVSKDNTVEVQTNLRHGRFIENLVELQDEVSMLVVGRYGRKHFEQKQQDVVGHKVEAVVRAIEKPVLIVDRDFFQPNAILLAYDGSAAANKALAYVATDAMFDDVFVHVVYVGSTDGGASYMLQTAESMLEQNNRSYQSTKLTGHPADTIKNYVARHELDMVVMGAFGHHWLREMVMGSFTSQMLTSRITPLLLVR